jgi:hypothetical protein
MASARAGLSSLGQSGTRITRSTGARVSESGVHCRQYGCQGRRCRETKDGQQANAAPGQL